MKKSDTQILNVQEAKSGKTGFTDPVVLHDSKKSRVDMVTNYISRTSGTEISIKLNVFDKSEALPLGLKANPSKSITLDNQAAKNLAYEIIKSIELAGGSGPGRYLVQRLDGDINVDSINEADYARILQEMLNNSKISKILNQLSLDSELANAINSVARLKEMENALAELHNNMNNDDLLEQVYLEWCEKHAWVFGNFYVMNEVKFRNLTTQDTLDISLKNILTGLQDIIELKRPNMKVLNYDKDHRNYYFSVEVAKVIGQCHRYLDKLQEHALNGFEFNNDIIGYHPRALIVIGRSNDWEPVQHRSLHGLNSRLHGITIMTYDQLLSCGSRMLDILKSNYDKNIFDETTIDDDC